MATPTRTVRTRAWLPTEHGINYMCTSITRPQAKGIVLLLPKSETLLLCFLTKTDPYHQLHVLYISIFLVMVGVRLSITLLPTTIQSLHSLHTIVKCVAIGLGRPCNFISPLIFFENGWHQESQRLPN